MATLDCSSGLWWHGGEAINLAAREQKSADTVNLRGVVVEFFRVGTDGLDMRQFAVGLDAGFSDDSNSYGIGVRWDFGRN